MAEKKFGVRDLEIIDPTGTPTIESTGQLNINASHTEFGQTGGTVGIGSTNVAGRDAGISTSTGTLIYIPDTGIQIWTGYSWRTIESTSATTYSVTRPNC